MTPKSKALNKIGFSRLHKKKTGYSMRDESITGTVSNKSTKELLREIREHDRKYNSKR